MRKLSIYILCLVVLVVLVFVVAPYYVGSTIQSHVAKYAAKIKQTNPNVDIKVLDYDRKWNHSDATLQVQYPLPFVGNMGMKSPKFTSQFKAHIQHGPFIIYKDADGKTHYRLAKAMITITGVGKDMVGSTNTVIHWNNSISTTVNLKKLALKNQDVNVDINNLKGTYTFSPTKKMLQYSFNADNGVLHYNMQLPVEKIQVVYTVDNMSAHGKLHKDMDIWFGTRIDRMGSLTLHEKILGNPAKKTNILMKFTDRQSTVNMTQNQGKTDIFINMQAKDVQLQQWKFGRSYLTASMKGLDTQSLSKFMTLVKKGYASGDSQNPMFFANIGFASIGMLQKGATFNLQRLEMASLDKNTPAIKANAMLKVAPVSAKDAGIMDYVHSVSAKGNISLPENLLLSSLTGFYGDMLSHDKATNQTGASLANQALKTWSNNKMLIMKPDKSVSMSFSFEKGKLLVNGNKPNFKLPQLGKQHATTEKSQTQQQQPARRGFFFK